MSDAREAATWISEALTSSGYEADFSIASAKEVDIRELIRRNSEGWEWVPAKDDPEDEINLSLRRGGEVISPVQRVMKRYRNGSEDGIAAYVASVTAGTS